MFAFPMLIVWIILAGVLICVFAAISIAWWKGDPIGIKPFTILAITIFVTSVLGYFVTGFASFTPEDWAVPLVVRVCWQLGGAILLALALVIEAPAKRITWILGTVFLLLGLLMSFNALLDLIQGPLLLQGEVDLTVEKFHRSTRGGDAIFAQLELTAPDGSKHQIDMVGWGATDAIEKLSGCSGTIRILVLPHLQRVIDAKC